MSSNTRSERVYPPWVHTASGYAHTVLGKLLQWPEEKIKQVVFSSYGISLVESDRIVEVPQRSSEWKRIRAGWVELDKEIFRGTLVSSSVVGTILKHKDEFGPAKQYPDGTEQKYGMLFRTQRGTAYEGPTQEEFSLVMREHLGPDIEYSIEEVGLRVSPKLPYCAASIDSKIHMFNKITGEYSTAGLEMKCRGTKEALPPAWIPKSYYDQIMISMYIYGWDHYWFVFHSKSVFSVERFEFDPKTWSKYLACIDAWYWSNYWPTLVLVYLGIFTIEGIDISCSGEENSTMEKIFNWSLKNDISNALGSMNLKKKDIV